MLGNLEVRKVTDRNIAWDRPKGFLYEEEKLSVAKCAAKKAMKSCTTACPARSPAPDGRYYGGVNSFGFGTGRRRIALLFDPDEDLSIWYFENTRRESRQACIAFTLQELWSPGLIAGFDSEEDSIADLTAQLIEELAIPVCMIGLLTALPNTQLARRLKREGRLSVDYDLNSAGDGDHCNAAGQGLNFTTLRPRRAVFADARTDRQSLSTRTLLREATSRCARLIAPVITRRSLCARTLN